MNSAALSGDARSRILDAALGLAEDSSWESVRLLDVAIALDVPLTEIARYFREKEELVDAWFDRADQAMLTLARQPGFLILDDRERMHRAIMSWLRALSSHRRVTRQMILGKLEPGHLHIQIPGLMRISRTVQWIRETAGRNATLPRRAIEETVHTSIYLSTFACWLQDDSPDFERTSRLLERLLRNAARVGI